MGGPFDPIGENAVWVVDTGAFIACGRQQNTLIDSQFQAANEMAQRGDTTPVAFADARDRHRTNDDTYSTRDDIETIVAGPYSVARWLCIPATS